ncbi:hypothetical protein [Tellurirhabdus bombi]|uniref:hypothetical protein n=1 Tax=Tellurirhabdus bombi TaxID=2907205 RepID=UPI001F17BA16|nr:hypothetical protein [Tellurirhabdus bombi]
MKRLILFVTIALGLFKQAYAQQDKYVKAMESAIAKVNFMASKDDLLQSASQFERIGGAEANEWLPNYWSAYTYSIMAYKEQDAAKKDAFLDKADAFFEKALKQQPDNDELMVLQAQLAGARLAVDPQNRWQKYGDIYQTALDKATAKNAENPRIYYLQGQSLLYKPEQYGGGKKVACPLLQKAAEKFATFKATTRIHPNWGAEETKYAMKQCAGQ